MSSTQVVSVSEGDGGGEGRSLRRRGLGFLLLILSLLTVTPILADWQGARSLGPCIRLPAGPRPAPSPHQGLVDTRLVLQRDTGIQYNVADGWKAGDRLGVVLEASLLQYPLTVEAVQAYVSRWSSPHGDSADSVRIRGHVYRLTAGQPSELLGSSAVVTVDLSGADPWARTWQELPLETPVVLSTPQAFLAVVEYVDGSPGSTPSVVIDASDHIDAGVCFFHLGAGGWLEHYDVAWRNADDVGYQMIRARVDTSGGPGDRTMLLATEDTFLASAIDVPGLDLQPYLLVGYDGPQWGNLRALLRFPLPEAPVVSASIEQAALRLYHYEELSSTVPIEITAHRVTEPWSADGATWDACASGHAEGYGVAQIPACPADQRRKHILYFDLTDLVRKWIDGVYENLGVMLIGGEDTVGSAKRLRSADAASRPEAEHPQLLLSWALPSPTPSCTPTSSPSATPTPTPTASVTPTTSSTPTASPSPTASPTPSSTLTLTGTPTAGPVQLFLPLIRKPDQALAAENTARALQEVD